MKLRAYKDVVAKRRRAGVTSSSSPSPLSSKKNSFVLLFENEHYAEYADYSPESLQKIILWRERNHHNQHSNEQEESLSDDDDDDDDYSSPSSSSSSSSATTTSGPISDEQHVSLEQQKRPPPTTIIMEEQQQPPPNVTNVGKKISTLATQAALAPSPLVVFDYATPAFAPTLGKRVKERQSRQKSISPTPTFDPSELPYSFPLLRLIPVNFHTPPSRMTRKLPNENSLPTRTMTTLLLPKRR
jgi:hypothetical protein